MSADSATHAPPAPRSVRITRFDEGVELYFPPLRSIGPACGLLLFGVVGGGMGTFSAAILLSFFVHSAGTLLMTALLAGFVLPFMVFGAVFVVLAVYMVANALYVRADASTIETARMLGGVVVRRHRVSRNEIERIDSQLPSRYQNVFGGGPAYHLVVRTVGWRRIVVAETLHGEDEMARVKALLENPGLQPSENPT